MRLSLALLLFAFSSLLGQDSQADKDLESLKAAADKGDVLSQLKLGDKYYWGKGVPKDFEEAVKYFQKAADQGDDMAQERMGGAVIRAME